MSMIGKILGNFEITSQLGKGGMGEVYQAKDRKLGRDVAIKVLPEEFARDADRVARFQREAKLLASLNHPNIAAIHGLEEFAGTNFLVLELVEGETLADRLQRGTIPIEEALKLALQIAEALEAAHEKGVIHRDLKPANIKITPDGKVKVLDFGLAKALADETQSVNSSQSPTITEAMTRPGVILGTAAYMSPEQAKGKAVDKRADIWAFGCILYECLTGKRAFEGETVTETLAAVLTRELDWERIPSKVRPLLRRCLERDPKKRLRDIGEAMAWIDCAPVTVPESTPAKRPWLAWSVAAVLLIAFLLLAFMHFRESEPAQSELMKLQIMPPINLKEPDSFLISPDGRHLAFTGEKSETTKCLWLRSLNSLDPKPLLGTESNVIPPFFWSPDSRFIYFGSGGKLKKIPAIGGPPQEICDITAFVVGGSCNQDGVVIFGSGQGGLMRAPSTESAAAFPLTKLNPARKEQYHGLPTFLPDGKHFLYWIYSGDDNQNTGVYIGSLDSKAEEQDRHKLLATNRQFVYIPSQNSIPGIILFIIGRTLMAQQFDEKFLKPEGDATQIVEQVSVSAYNARFSASTKGILVYVAGSVDRLSQATWFDRQGKPLGVVGDPASFYGLAIFPSSAGMQVAAGRIDSRQLDLNPDIWLNSDKRFTFGQGGNYFPVWSPDGERLVFSSSRDPGLSLFQKPANSAKDEELLSKDEGNRDLIATSWSRDGRFLLYHTWDPKLFKSELGVLPMEGDRRPIKFPLTKSNEFDGHFSPDGRFIAYTSDETGKRDIYIRPFPPTSGGKPVSKAGGGTGARWSSNGMELCFRAPDGRVMAVKITPAGALPEVGTPTQLFAAPPDISLLAVDYGFPFWDVTADGNRFLIPVPVEKSAPSPFTVILNWTSLLKK